MNCRRHFFFLFFFLVMAFPGNVLGQDLTGIWRGYFVAANTGEQYKLEFQIKQNPTANVKGVSYSFLDTRFYGKATMTGVFTKQNKTFNIQELRTTEVKMSGASSTCLMNYHLVLSTSGNEQFLEGTFLGKTEDRVDPKNNGTWGDCGSGRVYLRKVTTSEFYLEPFLRNETTAKKPVTPLKQPATTAKKPPVGPSTAQSSKPSTNSKAPVKKPVTTKVAPPKPQISTSTIPQKKKTTEVEKDQSTVTSAPKKITREVFIPIETRSRKNETVKVFTVTNREVTVKLYDNGEIDNDTISVYLDNERIVANKKLTAAPITFSIKMEEQSEHTLVMVAENMGRIPPNTSLMIVYDGEKRYEVSITSTEQKNAMVRFRHKSE